MIYISDEGELNINAGLQALYFYSHWLPYHNKMTIMIEKTEQKHKNIKFTAIDTDHFKILCKRFSVESIPEVIVFKDGAETNRFNGLIMTSAFRSAFADICK